MSRVFKVWLNSGANIHSKYTTTIALDDMGIESEEWDDMSDAEQSEVMHEHAFERSDWGFSEVTD